MEHRKQSELTIDDIVKVIGIGPSRLALICERGGVYELLRDGKKTHYVKRSDELLYNFAFVNLCDGFRILSIYSDLAKDRFYHPDTIFRLGTNKTGRFYILSIMPALDAHTSQAERKFRRDLANKQRILHDTLEIHKIERGYILYTHNDIQFGFNYGYKRKELFYHDLHL